MYRENWNIQLTKTGFTNNAGHCLVMRTVINGRPVALVVLDAFGKYTPLRRRQPPAKLDGNRQSDPGSGSSVKLQAL
ncbi:D-alanyl-D-alanine endopeptidase precursor [Cedecea neteri]|uniref:D-alanyl-D-alanine endopeptidase n=1 Tax=Cedecea neteri TaxID=158822 RepID=A0A2X2STT8_9ENTR|nr:D-alanyl-D-alanine endopeptidase precursor [Cedecea neteri]